MICEKFLSLDIYKNSNTILAYYPLPYEVNILPIIKKALKDKKKVALPITLDKCGNMEFYFIKNLNDLKKGNYGILEPIMESKNKVNIFDNSICIVPGICFDLDKYRVGYGKGYYDRFLNLFKGVSIGLCYFECLIDKIKVDKYDQKVDIILTDIKSVI